MQKRACEEASGAPLQSKLRRRETLSAAKDTLRHLHSANHVITADVASEKHRGWLQDMVSAVGETVKLLENTDKNGAPEEPLYDPTSPLWSPTSPEYGSDEDAGEDEGRLDDDEVDEPVYAVLIGPAAEPQRMDAVEAYTLHHGVKTGILIGKDKGQGIVRFPNGDIGIHAMADLREAF